MNWAIEAYVRCQAGEKSWLDHHLHVAQAGVLVDAPCTVLIPFNDKPVSSVVVVVSIVDKLAIDPSTVASPIIPCTTYFETHAVLECEDSVVAGVVSVYYTSRGDLLKLVVVVVVVVVAVVIVRVVVVVLVMSMMAVPVSITYIEADA